MDIDIGGIASEIKQTVSMEDVCRQYGIEINRAGFAKCCFHADRKPSMKVYPGNGGFHCFSCGAHGDIFHIVEKLYGCDFMTSLRTVIQDFNLPYDLDSTDDRKQKELEERLRAERLKQHRREQEELRRQAEYRKWQDIFTMYDKWLTEYEPIWPDEEPDARYAEACRNIDYAWERMMLAAEQK